MSTKSTLFAGEDWHIYEDDFPRKTYLEIKGEIIDLPDDLRKVLDYLISFHYNMKNIIQIVKRLDKVDGGIFGLDLETGKVSEFDGENFVEED